MNRSSERNYYIYSGGIAIDSISLLLELLCRGMFILNPQVQPNKKNLEDIRASYNAQKKQLERKKPDDIDSSNDVRQKHDCLNLSLWLDLAFLCSVENVF